MGSGLLGAALGRAQPKRRDLANWTRMPSTIRWLDLELIHSIVCFVSLSGCIWHLSDVSSIYFSYNTTVNVNFEREITVQMPGVTICMNSSLTVNEDYFTSRYPALQNTSQYKNAKYLVLGNMLNNLTLKEQLLEATVDYKQVFNSCLIMKPIAFEEESKDYVECDKISPIRQYITYSKKCFLIASQLEKEESTRFMVDHDTTLRDNGFPLFEIRLNNRYLDQLVVFIQARTIPFLNLIGGQTNGIHLNNTKYVSYTLNYVKTSSHLLPPPFHTMCRDYNTIGYKSLAHCVISCKANYFINEFHGWHPDIPANVEFNLDINYSKFELKQNQTLDKMMAERCLGVCSKMQDCTSEYYSTSVIGQFERSVHEPQYDHLHGIFIYLPSGLHTRYTHSPRLHLIEYICYFASVFSLWFGFSIIAVSKMLIKVYRLYVANSAIDQPSTIQLKTNEKRMTSD